VITLVKCAGHSRKQLTRILLSPLKILNNYNNNLHTLASQQNTSQKSN